MYIIRLFARTANHAIPTLKRSLSLSQNVWCFKTFQAKVPGGIIFPNGQVVISLHSQTPVPVAMLAAGLLQKQTKTGDFHAFW